MANNCNSVQQFRHQVRSSLLYPPSNTLFTRRSMLFVLLSFLTRTWFTRCKLHISTVVVVAEDRPFFIHSSFFKLVVYYIVLSVCCFSCLCCLCRSAVFYYYVVVLILRRNDGNRRRIHRSVGRRTGAPTRCTLHSP